MSVKSNGSKGQKIWRSCGTSSIQRGNSASKASTQKTKQKEREREREIRRGGGRDETRGSDRWGPDLRVATGTFARCFLHFGVSRVFLDRVWRKGRVTRTQLLVTTTYQGPFHRPELIPFQNRRNGSTTRACSGA